MKPFLSIGIIIILMIFLSSCVSVPISQPPTDKTTRFIETEKAKATTAINITNKIPVYIPGSIRLTEGGIAEDFFFTPTKRRVYYGIPGAVTELIPSGTISKLFYENQDLYTEPVEMTLVTLIKHCKIPKKIFEEAVAIEKEKSESAGFDLTHEENELPNADIIYTFDNDIINEYYRRE